MNILYIHSHDTGRYIQPYGHAVPTPHLQHLAEEGVLFRQAFCAGPTCSPSRAALLTGQCPHSAGMIGLAHRGFSLADPSRHLASFLRRSGYATVLCGVQHEASGSEAFRHLGYDQAMKRPHPEEDAATFLASAPPQPFFLSVGFGLTHRAYPPADPDLLAGYNQPPLPLPDVPEIRADMAAFKTAARELDRRIGVVLAALGRHGLDRNTLVMATTDHGIAFPRMKCTLTDQGIGVLLILRGPREGQWAELLTGGRVEEALVSHMDLYPTLCDLLGLEKPAWLEGHSLLPLLRRETTSVREAIFAEVTYHAAYEPMRAVRTSRWKYIRRYDGRMRPVLCNCDDSPSKTWMLDHGWGEEPVEEEVLYDLALDPHERVNRARWPACAAVLAEMRERLERWMRETHDPLLKGPVRAPVGAEINDPDDPSPRLPPRRIES